MIKIKIVLLLLQALMLSSCDQGQNLLMKILGRDEKELVTLHSEKVFFISSKSSYIAVEGIWKIISEHDASYALFISNRDLISLPHIVEVVCEKETMRCSLRETIIGMMPISDKYYLTTNESPHFRITTWDKNKLIAIDDDTSSCLFRVLYIDINTQEVLIKSVVKSNNTDEYCEKFKSQSMPIIHKLVDYRESPWEYYITLTVKPKRKSES